VSRRFHPEGVAALVAVMLAPEGVDDEVYAHAVDFVRERVLELADEYYALYPCDFDNSTDRREDRGTNNLAKLSRANLR
jgi:hypothetical protein